MQTSLSRLKRFFLKTGVALSIFLSASSAYATDVASKTELVSQLFSEDDSTADAAAEALSRQNDPSILPLILVNLDRSTHLEALARAIEVAAPICDSTCVPYLATNLRHNDRGVVLASAHAAELLARPELRPALLDLVVNNTDELVRLTAANALIRITPDEAYDELFAFVLSKAPNAASLAIVRALPKSRMSDFVPRFAELALNPNYATSVIAAYTRCDQAHLLFDVLVRMSVENLPNAQREALLRALRRLAPYAASKASVFASERLRSFAESTTTLESVQVSARMLASFDGMLPTILRRAAVYPEAFTPDVVADIVDHLSEQDCAQLVDMLLLDDGVTSEPFGRKQLLNIETPSVATMALLRRMQGMHTSEVMRFGIEATYSHNDSVVEQAIDILGAEDDPSASVTQRLTSLLGRRGTAQRAALALKTPVALAADTNDVPGAQLYARWANAAIARRIAPSPEAIAEARKIVENPRRRHALPAMALLVAAHEVPPEIEMDVLQTLATDMQRLWLKAKCSSGTATVELMQTALNTNTLCAEALSCLNEDLELARSTFSDTQTLVPLIRAQNPQVALRAMRLTALLAEQQMRMDSKVRSALEARLFDKDQRLPHNALRALQALHALPARDTLLSLYGRATLPQTRNYLALLGGLTVFEDEPESGRSKSALGAAQTKLGSHYIFTYDHGAFDVLDAASTAVQFGF